MIMANEIKRSRWDEATKLRGSMDASRYKDYMFGGSSRRSQKGLD